MSVRTAMLAILLGAVLAFALRVEVDWIDLRLVGHLLMVAGVVGLVLRVALIALNETVRARRLGGRARW